MAQLFDVLNLLIVLFKAKYVENNNFHLKIEELVQLLPLFIKSPACCTSSDTLPNSDHLNVALSMSSYRLMKVENPLALVETFPIYHLSAHHL